MLSQLVCRPEQDLPVAVLRVRGTLDLGTADALEQAVRRCLATEPEELLIDVSGLCVRDSLALDVLAGVASQTADWPAVPIVLCGAGTETGLAVAAWPSRASVSTAESCERALAEASERPAPRRIRMRLRPVPDACREARQLVARACTSWQLADLNAAAALVATELVANVVRHAHTSMEIIVGMHDERLCMSVRDGSRHLPRHVDPALTDAGGRGLRLVRDLTEAWGVLPTSDGKVVWTRMQGSQVPADLGRLR